MAVLITQKMLKVLRAGGRSKLKMISNKYLKWPIPKKNLTTFAEWMLRSNSQHRISGPRKTAKVDQCCSSFLSGSLKIDQMAALPCRKIFNFQLAVTELLAKVDQCCSRFLSGSLKIDQMAAFPCRKIFNFQLAVTELLAKNEQCWPVFLSNSLKIDQMAAFLCRKIFNF